MKYKFRYKDAGKVYNVGSIDFMNNYAFLIAEDNSETKLIEIDPDKLLLYTGRKDKSGKEVYEGDIVRFPKYLIGDYVEPEHTETVEFDCGFNDDLCFMGSMDHAEYCEIVG